MTILRTTLSVVLVSIVSLLSLHAQSSDTVRIHYSHHGAQYGAPHRTLAAIELPTLSSAQDITFTFDLPASTRTAMSSLEVLISDTLVVRDLEDYKERVTYHALPVSMSGSKFSTRLPKGSHTLYLVANLKPQSATSKPGIDLLTASIKGVTVGRKVHPLLHEGEKAQRRLFEIYKPLYVPGDTGSRNFRIPALLRTQAGTILAVADRRKFNQTDIPEDIDITIRRSEDGGKTWSEPSIIIAGHGRGKGFGDAALVQTKSGKIVMVFIGGPGLWHSTPEAPQPTYVMTSDDDGRTWSEARDITPFLYGHECSEPIRQKFLSSFCASGQGLLSSTGRIMFVAAMRTSQDYTLDNYLIYSDDEGETWQVSEEAYKLGDESKVIQLQDGSILMSIRNPRKGKRIFKVSHDDGHTWQDTPKYGGLHDPACNGTPLFIPRGSKQVLIHSLPFGPNERRDGAIYTYDAAKDKWSDATVINPGMSAYSDMILLDDHHIGYFVEEDDEMSLVFIKVPTSLLK